MQLVRSSYLLLMLNLQCMMDIIEKQDITEEKVLYYVKQALDIYPKFAKAKNSNASTLLHSAAKSGHSSVVKYLIERGVGVNVKDNRGKIPLYYALYYGNLDTAKCLIEEFDIKNGYTPLHWVAANGDLAMLKYLIHIKKSYVNVMDRYRYTPLHYAVQNDKLDIIKYLIGDKKANLNVKNKYGETPVDLAVKNDYINTIKYFMNETGFNTTDKLIYTLSTVHKNVDSLGLLAKGKGVIIDRVIGIVDIAFGIKDILQDFGILPDKQSEEFEKVLNAIGKNYAAIEEVGNKVDRNFVAMKVISELVSKTLSTIEETRIEMRQGFKHVLESINELKVGDKISSLTTFMDDFLKDISIVKELSSNVRVTELERTGGILDRLKNAVTSEGILHGNLYHIINQRLAIPKEAEDNVGFTTLHVLYYGVQTYVSVMFFVLEQYSYLADHYYQKGDIEKCNEYFDLLQISFKDFKTSLLSNSNKKQLIDKVSGILSEVQGLPFVRNKREDVFKLLHKRIDSLSLVTEKLQEMILPIVADQPEVIMRKPDFSKSEVKTPIGEWKDGAKVSYAIQYKENNTYSKVGEWSDAFTVYQKANPFLKIPIDPQRRTRLIFRKFNNNQPELVDIIEDKYQTNFRDISRDLYDAALSSNEDIARKEVEILLRNGADMNKSYENGRQAIHAAAQSGNSQIASDFLIKNNDTDINVKDANGYTPIYIAAEAGYEGFVKFLLSNGADVNVKTNSDNFTPLHISAYKGDVSTVEVLMQSDKIDINARDKVGFTPLHSAVFGGTYVVNTLSLSNNTDINAQSNEGLTPLHIASINDFEDIAEYLLKNNKVDINAEANGNLTALHFASSMGNLKVAKVLLSHNKTKINLKSSDGWTPLHYAAFLKKEDTALELLKAHNIDVNVKGKNNITSLHVATVTGQKNITVDLLKKGALIEEKTTDGFTALQLAAMHNKHEIASILIDNGANIEAKTANGSTPLHLASSYGSKETTLVLLNKGADTKTYDDIGQTPIHVAVLNGKAEVVRVLVEYDLNLIILKTKENLNRASSLHLAAQKNYLDIMKYLIDEKKADFNINDKVGETPLHYAAKFGCLDIVKYLVDEKMVDVDIGNDFQETPLHFAALSGNLELVKYYVDEKKADISSRNKVGNSLLHFAALSGNLDVVKYFINEKNIAITITNGNSETPLEYAIWYSKFDVVKYLLEKYALENNNIYSAAAVSGNLDLVKYLIDKKKNDVKYFPLFLAARYGYLDIVKYFVDEKKVEFSTRASGASLTPLYHSAVSGNLDLVKYFVDEKKVDVNTLYTLLLLTPFCFAALSGNLELVKYFVDEKGVSINSKVRFGANPLSFAVASGNLDLIKYFIDEKKIDVNIAHSCPSTTKHSLYSLDLDISHIKFNLYELQNSITLHYGATSLLFCAAGRGYLDVVKYLIEEKKLDVNTRALYFAITADHLDIVKYLVDEKNIDANITTDSNVKTNLYLATSLDMVRYLVDEKKLNINTRDGGYTLLHRAVEHNKLDKVRYFIEEKKFDVNIKSNDSYSYTPLHLAAKDGFVSISRYLIEKGADVNNKNNEGSTPLHFAAENADLKGVKYFIKNKADINAKDKKFNTPLHMITGSKITFTVVHEQLDIIKNLVENGADINAKNSQGMTPLFLYFIVKEGNLELVKYFVENGADVNAKESSGFTCLDVSRNTDVNEYLKSHGAHCGYSRCGIKPAFLDLRKYKKKYYMSISEQSNAVNK